MQEKNWKDTKECHYCKHILPTEAKFCPYCLEKLVEVEVITLQKDKGTKKHMRRNLILSGVFAYLAVGICAISILDRRKNNNYIYNDKLAKQELSVENWYELIGEQNLLMLTVRELNTTTPDGEKIEVQNINNIAGTNPPAAGVLNEIISLAEEAANEEVDGSSIFVQANPGGILSGITTKVTTGVYGNASGKVTTSKKQNTTTTKKTTNTTTSNRVTTNKTTTGKVTIGSTTQQIQTTEPQTTQPQTTEQEVTESPIDSPEMLDFYRNAYLYQNGIAPLPDKLDDKMYSWQELQNELYDQMVSYYGKSNVKLRSEYYKVHTNEINSYVEYKIEAFMTTVYATFSDRVNGSFEFYIYLPNRYPYNAATGKYVKTEDVDRKNYKLIRMVIDAWQEDSNCASYLPAVDSYSCNEQNYEKTVSTDKWVMKINIISDSTCEFSLRYN